MTNEVAFRVVVEANEVEFGRAFPLTVVRAWPKACEPDEWRDELLAPLVLRPIDTAREERGDQIEETRRFDGFAFVRKEVRVAAPTFTARPRDGSAALVAPATELHLRVRSALASDTPGPPELPSEPLPIGASSWLGWSIGAGTVALAAAAWIVARRRKIARLRGRASSAARRLSDDGSKRVATAAERALARIARLRDAVPQSPAAIDAWYVEAAALLRDDLADRFAALVPASLPTRTSEQLVAAMASARSLATEHCLELERLLTRCDRAKFGRLVAGSVDRARFLDELERFVRAIDVGGRGVRFNASATP